jgi:hypothetical protein
VIKGAIGGIALASTTQKVWRVAQALGDIAFAYPFSLVLLEIEVGQYRENVMHLCLVFMRADMVYDEGHTEVATGGERDDEEGVEG